MSTNDESSDILSVYFLGEMVTKSLKSPNRVRLGAFSTIVSEHGELVNVQSSARSFREIDFSELTSRNV
jgi:hypothetical protein